MMSWLRRLGRRSETPTAPAPNTAPGTVAPIPSVDLPHDKIEARAYEIWVRKGKPPGQDLQNWTEAEAELRAEFAAHPDPELPPRKPR